MSVKRYKLTETVGYENEFHDCGLRIPAGQVMIRADDYDAETARADRAEAGCAAAKRAAQGILGWFDRRGTINEEVQPHLDRLIEIADQPHPGSRFLDLAQIVEGLPVVDGDIHVQEGSEGWFFHVVSTKDGAQTHLQTFSGETAKQYADALARLLAWRGKP